MSFSGLDRIDSGRSSSGSVAIATKLEESIE